MWKKPGNSIFLNSSKKKVKKKKKKSGIGKIYF